MANAWQAYEIYHTSQTDGSTSVAQGSDYSTFYDYAQAAAQGLMPVQSKLNTLISSDAAYTSQATALANDVIGVQSSLPTPAVSL